MLRNKNLLAAALLASVMVLGNSAISPARAYQGYAKSGPQASAQMMSGKVVSTKDVAGYTYAQVDTGKEKVWVAGPQTKLNLGDRVSFSSGMPVENYHSKILNRQFKLIYFVGHYFNAEGEGIGAKKEMSSPHTGMKLKAQAEPIKGIPKLKGGHSIAEIYAQKDTLKGRTIRVRGKVSKFNKEIMGRNWLHLRDSSTLEDITVTTKSVVKPGDNVIVEGKLSLDRDFKYGYIYTVILEDARITKK